ncbi:UNVERIFIED_CONTAM: Vesicle transport v-SNARE 13 [Sesamum angustifolium]|uniref:Vesicle transport v-SNARE 13 n=1 Tax=Sesamum angustifolium TaxID=2727405 RepID=A0AAW2M7U2_9LAMI
MSQVFDSYERQYCELSANLSKKITSANLLDGEQKKQKISEVVGGFEDGEALIRKMDLEARSLPPSVKTMLLAKLREYKTDLNNLKMDVKRITSANTNQAARDELLEWNCRYFNGIWILLSFKCTCTYFLGGQAWQSLHPQREMYQGSNSYFDARQFKIGRHTVG